MKITEIVAWWGAIVSTAVLLWDVYKWKTSGPDVSFTVHTGMETIGDPRHDGAAVITVSVTNRGDRPTTLTNLGYLQYKTTNKKGWKFWRLRIPDFAAVILPTTTQAPIPCELKPGAVWCAYSAQTTRLEELASSGKLYCLLYHSHAEKPIRKRVLVYKR
jgi:hypothetical protein